MTGKVPLSGEEIKALMALQYEFPLDTTRPYDYLASQLGTTTRQLLETARRLNEAGVLKRVGFYYNYRARRKVAALVAYAAGDRYKTLADIVNRDPMVTHNFLRNHPYYNVWIVVKRDTRDEIIEFVEETSRKAGVEDWVILFSRRTLKLSVKYDLIEGVSKAGRYTWVNPNPPTPEELGIPKTLPHSVRALPLEERPYASAARKHGMTEEDVLDLVNQMLEKGILGDPGAALEGRLAGFTENGMVVLEPVDCSMEEGLCNCVRSFPYSTHVVWRESYPPGKWRHICYFMVHATSKDRIEEVRRKAEKECKPRSSMVLYSLMDLKPHVVR